MHKFWLCFAAVLLFAVAAQAAPKAEIFGGYQYTRLQGSTTSTPGLPTSSGPGTNMNGWNGALTGNMGHLLGVTADLSGVYRSGFHLHTYTFGPEVHAHLPLMKPFVHALFGGAHIVAGPVSTTGFAMYVGGGIDAGSGLVGFRVVQFDWMDMRFSGGNSSKNVRISTGLVLRF